MHIFAGDWERYYQRAFRDMRKRWKSDFKESKEAFGGSGTLNGLQSTRNGNQSILCLLYFKE